MRQISPLQVTVFVVLLCVIVALGIASAWALLSYMPPGDFRGVAGLVAAIILVYAWALVIYRAFLLVVPLEEGEIEERSRAEFAAQVNILFYLVLFNSLIRTHFLPVPLVRLIYIALGARLGRNTYSAGVILDPPLTRVGDNCIIGHDAVLFSHAIEGRRLSLSRIQIGNDVTVGATAVIMSGVVIDDGAVVSAGAVVTKGTHIGAREVWGGVPAKLLRRTGVPSESAFG